MAKQYSTYFVSWRQAKSRPFGWFANEASYAKAAAEALENRLNQLADDGWIIDRILPIQGLTPPQSAGFTIVAFK